MSHHDLLSGLNPSQQQAVTTESQHTLVLAGAGSGKTRVLIHRVAYLLKEKNVSLQEMFVVTFTNKAAKELIERTAHITGRNPRMMWIGTFHSLSHRFLRLHHQIAGLSNNFQIIDRQEQESIVKKILKEKQVSDQLYPLKNILDLINYTKEKGLRQPVNSGNGRSNDRYFEAWQWYEEYCHKNQLVDFSELLIRTVETLERHDDLRTHYQERFSHILVDEFQDTNPLQYRLIKLLLGDVGADITKNQKNQKTTKLSKEKQEEQKGKQQEQEKPKKHSGNSLFVVGDDDQSIYGFRGAEIAQIRNLPQTMNAQIIKLEQNYRSTAHILAVANSVIDHNDDRLGKSLWTNSQDGEKVTLFKADDDRHEANWIVEQIRSLQKINGHHINHGAITTKETTAITATTEKNQVPLAPVRYQDIAILYRANALSRTIEQALFNAVVPYRVYGGLRFFDRQEIRHALSYLRLIANPHDDPALLRVINFPTRGIGAKTIEQLQELALQKQKSLFATIIDIAPDIQTKAAQSLRGFATLIVELKNTNDSGQLDLAQLIDETLRRSQLISHYENSKDEKDREDRIENLKQLIDAGRQFLQEEALEEGQTWLSSFLTFAVLEGQVESSEQKADGVQLMTIHAAKGLEFPYVFVVGLEQGIFPSERSLPLEIEEERRLMYVAVTRAKLKLYVSFANYRAWYGEGRYGRMSCFLEEIIDGCSDSLDLTNFSKKSSYNQQKSNYSNNPNFGNPNFGNPNFGNPNFGNPNFSDYQKSRNKKEGDNNRSSGLSDSTSSAKTKSNLSVSSTKTGWAVGQKVQHQKFGVGQILQVSGQEIIVRFQSVGVKHLALAYAKLEKV